MKKFFILAFVSLMVGSAMPLPSDALATVGAKINPGTVRPWGPQHMGGRKPTTVQQAVADAQHFNIITAQPGTYKNYVSAMKTANPKLLLFVYMNSTFTWQKDLPESTYSHDKYGRRIEAKQFRGTWLLNPAAAGAISYQQRRGAGLIAQSHYDGIYLDVLGPAPLDPNYVTGLPINPATKQVWTLSAWLKAVNNLALQVKKYVSPKHVTGNGLRDGPHYFASSAPTKGLLGSGIEAGTPEAWLRAATAAIGAYPTEAAWKQNVDMLVDCQKLGVSVLAMTKTWTTATQAQKDAWFKFALASYLLGNDGTSYFFFSYVRGDSVADYPFYHLNLGAASGSYAKASGVYQRGFAKGKVLVNPTTSTFTVPLGGTYKTLAGTSVTSVKLGPHSSSILLF